LRARSDDRVKWLNASGVLVTIPLLLDEWDIDNALIDP
jgi:hypothetical protein